MTSVYRPVLKVSLLTLARIPALVVFALPIALSGALFSPLSFLGWPNVIARIGFQFFAEPFFQFSLPETLTWKGALAGLLTIATTDTGAFVRLLIVLVITIALILLVLWSIPRATGALIESVRRNQVGETVRLVSLWRGSARSWSGLALLTIAIPLLPALWMLGVTQFASAWGQTLTSLTIIAGVLFAFATITTTIYANIYLVVGGYTTLEALRAGWQRLRTYFWTTVETSVLLLGVELALMAASFVVGSIALVPIALLLVIFWALKWKLLFSWMIVVTFALILLYLLLVAMTLITLATLIWTHLFYALEVTDDPSATRRYSRLFFAWIRRRFKRQSSV